ncbi:MAG TPA: hypothetical protein DDY91_02900 [Planctomycetaceae bacterium]|nr:hypothetical protein [Planctomycetaceae bacterium]
MWTGTCVTAGFQVLPTTQGCAIFDLAIPLLRRPGRCCDRGVGLRWGRTGIGENLRPADETGDKRYHHIRSVTILTKPLPVG